MDRSTDRPDQTASGHRPDDYDSLKHSITNHYEGLSKRLQDVAEFALAHPDEMALETIAVIASRAKVPPSSLIRFSKALGFDGFSEMQRLFRERLVAHMPSYGERIRRLRDQRRRDGEAAASILDSFTSAGIEALERLREDLPPERLEQAIELLAKARTIQVIGQRRAFSVAVYLTYLLNELDLRAVLLDGAGGMLGQQSRLVAEDSVLLVVSFRPYAPEVIELVQRCRERGLPIIGLTDGPLSPLARMASVSLEFVEGEVGDLRQLSASMCLALALAVALGDHLAKTSERN